MSIATRTGTQSPALDVADSHDLIRVHGALDADRRISGGLRRGHVACTRQVRMGTMQDSTCEMRSPSKMVVAAKLNRPPSLHSTLPTCATAIGASLLATRALPARTINDA